MIRSIGGFLKNLISPTPRIGEIANRLSNFKFPFKTYTIYPEKTARSPLKIHWKSEEEIREQAKADLKRRLEKILDDWNKEEPNLFPPNNARKP